MNDHVTIIDAFGGGTACARALSAVGHDVDRDTIHAWKARQRIPPKYWPGIVAAAQGKGLDVSFELLAGAAAPSQKLLTAASCAPKRGRLKDASRTSAI